MKFTIKLLFLGILLVNAAAFSMDRETSVAPVQQIAKLQGLPADIQKLILGALVQSNSLDEATKAISNLTKSKSSKFNALINDAKTTENIIKELARRFEASEILVAAKLNIFGSQLWLSNKILQNPKAGADELLKAIELHDAIAVKNLLKAGVNAKALKEDKSSLDHSFMRITSYYLSTKKISEYDKVIFKALVDAGAQFKFTNSSLLNNLRFAPHMPAIEKELGVAITQLLPR